MKWRVNAAAVNRTQVAQTVNEMQCVALWMEQRVANKYEEVHFKYSRVVVGLQKKVAASSNWIPGTYQRLPAIPTATRSQQRTIIINVRSGFVRGR